MVSIASVVVVVLEVVTGATVVVVVDDVVLEVYPSKSVTVSTGF